MRRPLLVDLPLGVVLGSVAVTVAVATSAAGGRYAGPGRGGFGPGPYGTDGGPPWWHHGLATGWSGWLLPVAVALAAGVALRRIRPRTGFGLVLLGGAGYLALGHPVVPLLPPLVLTGHALAVRRAGPGSGRPWWLLPLLVLPMLAAAAWPSRGAALTDPDLYGSALLTLAVVSAALASGLVRRTRVDAVRTERELQARRYAYAERLRVARDVHDVVGHSLSVISMQAGVALHVQQRRPEQLEASLLAIRETSQQALAELRATLETFRDPDFDLRPSTDFAAERAPVPGLDDLPALVDRLASAGRRVILRRSGSGSGPLPAAVDHAAYRIVQESLTNVVRHAGESDAEVEVEIAPDQVTVVVADRGPGPTGPVREGNGITGMRERALVAGGTLTTGARAGGGFEVRTVLPVPPGGPAESAAAGRP